MHEVMERDIWPGTISVSEIKQQSSLKQECFLRVTLPRGTSLSRDTLGASHTHTHPIQFTASIILLLTDHTYNFLWKIIFR